jgi:DNA-binding winged helix-turn-helix (wHTH) protein
MVDRASECAHEPGALRIAGWRVDPSLHRIRRESDVVRLEPKVMQVLVYLARHAGRVVSRDELAGEVWAGTIVGDDAITNAIGKLRRALGDDPRKPRFVETVAKSGYRLTAPVAPAEPPALPPATAQDPRSPGAYAREALGTAGTNPAVLGVLAFEQQGSEHEPSWLGDGLADELITALANVRTFLVLARSATFPYRDCGRAAPHIANELGAQYLIAGTVRQAGTRVRVTAELLDAHKGIVIWS